MCVCVCVCVCVYMHYSYRFSINLNSFQNKKLTPQPPPKRDLRSQRTTKGGALSAPYRSKARPERGFKDMKPDPFLSPLKPWDATDGQLLSFVESPAQVFALCPLPSCIESQPCHFMAERTWAPYPFKPPVFSPGKWKARKTAWGEKQYARDLAWDWLAKHSINVNCYYWFCYLTHWPGFTKKEMDLG